MNMQKTEGLGTKFPNKLCSQSPQNEALCKDFPFMPSNIDLAWAAGLLEGEGSFIWLASRRKLRVQMQHTDWDILIRLQKILGGIINDVPARENRKQCWNWGINRHSQAAGTMMMLFPFLGERRRSQVRDVLSRWRMAPVPRRMRPQQQRRASIGPVVASDL